MLGILNKKQIGDLAEDKACSFLQKKGFCLVERNYRSPFGELDLIMQDKNEVVFIEVRSRAYNTYGTAIDSINKAKQQKVRKKINFYNALELDRFSSGNVRYIYICADDSIQNEKLNYLI